MRWLGDSSFAGESEARRNVMKVLEIGEVPDELRCRPKANIGFMGLDPQGNSIHAAIWEAFSNNRGPDRAPINFTLLPEKHTFPKPKPKVSRHSIFDQCVSMPDFLGAAL